MCSIAGCILFTKTRHESELKAIEEKVRALILRGEDRGRDSFGLISFNTSGEAVEIKDVKRASRSVQLGERFIFPDTTIVISNDRAEPTTEYVWDKTPVDVQPFGSRIYISHNGIVANDHELEKKYGLQRRSRIDSAILPPLLEKAWDGTIQDLRRILCEELLGSFALAIVDKKRPSRLLLACNYKPIFLEYEREHDALYFTSLESYLQQTDKPLWESTVIRQMEPYSLLSVDVSRHLEKVTLWKSDPAEAKRALVVCSGGLDSTTAAKWIAERGYQVTLLHFKYRHRAERREEESVKGIAEKIGAELMIIDTDLFKKAIGHSRLTETMGEIETERGGEAGAEFAHEWVPARNLIFLAIATGIAEAYGFETIVLGNNLEEAGAYPDNEMIFINKLNEVLPYATNLQRRVRIEMPVGNLMKHEIVKLGTEIGAPLQLTWSCYEGGEKHCGRCGPCYMRRKAYEINGLTDPVSYDSYPINYLKQPARH